MQAEKLESPASKWLVGWSCGKETLKNGQYDTLKGSYYVNCAPAFEEQQESVATKYPSFPEYTAPNVWPSRELLPGFEETFRELCTLIIDIAVLVARACDRYAEANIEGYEKGYLEHVVKSSVSTKARLLHYFPNTQPAGAATSNDTGDEDDWCATHLDHGCLTGLTSAMFVDETANPPQTGSAFALLDELERSPDPKAGLYIHSRSGTVTKIGIPRDCLAFQTGEALEIITKGKFKAVPHFVRGAGPGVGGNVARNTLAVFTQPNLWDKVDERRDFAAFAKEIVEKNH
jgi:isopenicillin N synthase-like dioxygenase